MERNEGKLRARLARAKGGHRKVLQGRLNAMMAQRGEVEAAPAPAPAPAPVVKLAPFCGSGLRTYSPSVMVESFFIPVSPLFLMEGHYLR